MNQRRSLPKDTAVAIRIRLDNKHAMRRLIAFHRRVLKEYLDELNNHDFGELEMMVVATHESDGLRVRYKTPTRYVKEREA